jgi:hypothetical protein
MTHPIAKGQDNLLGIFFTKLAFINLIEGGR